MVSFDKNKIMSCSALSSKEDYDFFEEIWTDVNEKGISYDNLKTLCYAYNKNSDNSDYLSDCLRRVIGKHFENKKEIELLDFLIELIEIMYPNEAESLATHFNFFYPYINGRQIFKNRIPNLTKELKVKLLDLVKIQVKVLQVFDEHIDFYTGAMDIKNCLELNIDKN